VQDPDSGHTCGRALQSAEVATDRGPWRRTSPGSDTQEPVQDRPRVQRSTVVADQAHR